jgi:hypothetical protein
VRVNREELEEAILDGLDGGLSPAQVAAATGASVARVCQVRDEQARTAAAPAPRPLANRERDPRARPCRLCDAPIIDDERGAGPVNEGTGTPHLETCAGLTPRRRRELRGRLRRDERERIRGRGCIVISLGQPARRQ